jgi:hypothetical protein
MRRPVAVFCSTIAKTGASTMKGTIVQGSGVSPTLKMPKLVKPSGN